MKKLLLLFSLSIALSATAQTSVYHPFPDSNAVWCEEYGNPCGSCYYNYEQLQLNGKVQINGVTYNVLSSYISGYSCNDLLSCMGCVCYLGASSYNGPGLTYYMRQDSALKKVWIYDSIAHADTILYDFDLHIGDSLNRSKIYFGNSILIITSMDSVLINGQYRRRFFYTGYYYPMDSVALIEGIGSLSGLFRGPSVFEYQAFLDEFIQDNHVLYGDSIHINCPTYSLNIDRIKNEFSITLSPNPATNLLTITTTSTQPSEVILYDIASRQLMQQKFTGSATLNISHLAKGIYLYRVSDEKGIVKQGKVVKE